jgi:hypothetical protein
MTKLTRYTNIKDLKASKSLIQPQNSDSERESELKTVIALLKNHSFIPEQSKSGTSLNQSVSGK